jgi:hypothetical protein
MPETVVYGWECKLWVDSSASYAGTPGTPTWEELDSVEGVTLSCAPEALDVSPRAAGAFKVGLPGRVECKISGSIWWTNGKAELTALKAAAIGRSPLNVRALLGAATNADAKGVKGDFFFSKWDEKQEGEAVKVDFELMPYASIRANFVQADTGVAA